MVKQAKTTKSKAASDSIATSIDDIFASAGSSKLTPVPDQPASKKKKTKQEAVVLESSVDGKKVKSKVIKTSSSKPVSAASSVPKAVEVLEIVDPSVAVTAAVRDAVLRAKSDKGEKNRKRDRKALDEEETFRDSRGDGPRRRTEEGFLIFKEAELGIDPEAGGTPLCPFDCECCF